MRTLPYRTSMWKISIPTEIAGRVEMRLSNIQGTGPIYGSRSKLIAHLLSEWLDAAPEDAIRILEKAKEASKAGGQSSSGAESVEEVGGPGSFPPLNLD